MHFGRKQDNWTKNEVLARFFMKTDHVVKSHQAVTKRRQISKIRDFGKFRPNMNEKDISMGFAFSSTILSHFSQKTTEILNFGKFSQFQ